MSKLSLVVACVWIATGPAAADNPTLTGIDPPTVDIGLDPLPEGPVVVIAPRGVLIDGKVIVGIDHGKIAASDKEGGSTGVLVTNIDHYATAMFAEQTKRLGGKAAPPVIIAIDKGLSVELLLEVLFSLEHAGATHFALAAKGKNLGTVAITFTGGHPAAPSGKVGVVVTLDANQLAQWSLAGSEGTRKSPKTTVKRGELDKLLPALAEVAKRHGEKQIVLDVTDPNASAQDVVVLAAAARVTYPDVVLASFTD